MALPTVLMPGPMNRSVQAGLDGHFEVIRLWEADDPDALLAERAKDIVAVANAGTPIDGAFLDRFPALQLVASFGVGYDKIDATAAA
jgi:lactate dehydrogenase-like 2-hydroxyacid dehydrogenase